MNDSYNVVLETSRGCFQLLSYRDRIEWKKKTALKHAKDMKRENKYLSVGICPADHSAPVQEV